MASSKPDAPVPDPSTTPASTTLVILVYGRSDLPVGHPGRDAAALAKELVHTPQLRMSSDEDYIIEPHQHPKLLEEMFNVKEIRFPYDAKPTRGKTCDEDMATYRVNDLVVTRPDIQTCGKGLTKLRIFDIDAQGRGIASSCWDHQKVGHPEQCHSYFGLLSCNEFHYKKFSKGQRSAEWTVTKFTGWTEADLEKIKHLTPPRDVDEAVTLWKAERGMKPAPSSRPAAKVAKATRSSISQAKAPASEVLAIKISASSIASSGTSVTVIPGHKLANHLSSPSSSRMRSSKLRAAVPETDSSSGDDTDGEGNSSSGGKSSVTRKRKSDVKMGTRQSKKHLVQSLATTLPPAPRSTSAFSSRSTAPSRSTSIIDLTGESTGSEAHVDMAEQAGRVEKGSSRLACGDEMGPEGGAMPAGSAGDINHCAPATEDELKTTEGQISASLRFPAPDRPIAMYSDVTDNAPIAEMQELHQRFLDGDYKIADKLINQAVNNSQRLFSGATTYIDSMRSAYNKVYDQFEDRLSIACTEIDHQKVEAAAVVRRQEDEITRLKEDLKAVAHLEAEKLEWAGREEELQVELQAEVNERERMEVVAKGFQMAAEASFKRALVKK